MSQKGQPAADLRIKRQSLPEILAETLREQILNGEFKEGEALVQDAIAKKYDVSRIPVREALRQLEADGFVTIEVHKGAVVTSIPTDQIAELFDLRAMLECDLLARSLPKMSKADFAKTRSILTALEASYTQRDVASWGRLNWEFHRSLYVAADRPQTLLVVQGVNMQVDRYIRLQLLLTEAIEEAEKEHRELLRLCVSQDVEAAVAYLNQHILEAGQGLIAVLSKSREGPAASKGSQ